ncbi:MAG: aspartate aminotransferase family protein [Dehalococcoidia bacterium]
MARAAVDEGSLQRLIQRELDRFKSSTPGSVELLQRALRTLPLGVPSSFQDSPPYPLYVSHASGARIWDVDGNEYCDYHLGFGTLAVGHAHPRLVEALREQLPRGTMYAMPGEEAVLVAEELCRRFGFDMVRFCNSGTEATMDAIRVARGVTGRDMLIKIEGSYHGHHDSVMVSVKPPPDGLGPLEHPNSVVFSAGVPQAFVDLTLVVPFNRPDILEQRLRENEGKVAAVIIEPVMMNLGIVHPQPGYLQEMRRVTREHGVLLIYDEVKTGVTIAPGGACEHYGVMPDLVCLAKSIGGGIPLGAFGGSREVMEHIRPTEVAHLGTFNGNPLAMRAGLVTLTEILTAQAYQRFDQMKDKLVNGCQRIIDEHDLPMYATGIGAKGCVMFAAEELHDYREYLSFNVDLSYAHWLYLMNRGVMMPPGADEQWTLSIQHTDEDLDEHLAVFQDFARDLTAA